MQEPRMLSVRWMSACVASGLLLSAYACGGSKSGGSPDEDDTSDTTDGSGGTGGSGGNGSGGSSGEPGTGGSDGGNGGIGGSSTTDSGGTSTTGGSAGDGGSGGTMPEIDCVEDADCENANMVCDPLNELCVGCLFDSDCGTDERCEDAVCIENVACTSASDCEGVSGSEACDTAAGHCVECVYASDCPGTADCVDQRCRPYQACTNSLDCPTPRVCNTAIGRCAQCVSPNDCNDGLVCVESTCRRACSSDNDCTSLGLLCDFSYGACARCVYETDCPGEYHCASGRCELDTCETGTGYCEGNVLYTCNAAGSEYTATSCYYEQTCVEGEQATCQDWVCTPGATECNTAATEVITCAADGLSIEASVDCTETDELCYEGTCQDLVCPPFEYFCQDSDVYYCYSDGMTSYRSQECPTGQYCDDSGTTVQCVELFCEPDGPVCNGSLATTCNAVGDGYVAGGTDCSETEEYCVNGECRECNSSVLLLGDGNTTGNAAMQDALENAGMVVTLIDNGVSGYTGTPAASDFGAVVYGVGSSYSTTMAQAGQDAIVAAQAAGTGFVATELAAYQRYLGYNPSLAPLLLIQWSSSSYTTSFTLTESAHPIWDGLATTFAFTSALAVVGPLINSGATIATCASCDGGGSYSGAGVATREGTGGRLVHIAHSANYSGAIFYTDTNLLTMLTNAAQWAAGCK